MILDPQKSRRLIGAFEGVVQKPTGNRDLLEIITAHTSITHPDHKCGAMTAEVVSGRREGPIDKAAIEEVERGREAIENTFNDLLEKQGKNKMQQVAIIAMSDTDTMGFILNYQTDTEFSTTTLLRDGLARYIEDKIGGKVGVQGSMKDSFVKIDSFIDYSQKVVDITEFLLGLSPESSPFYRYVEDNYKKLIESQKQALRFVIARNIANQYVTGLTMEGVSHPFIHHSKRYISISPNGKPIGRFDITAESFGSTPRTREDALAQLNTKLSILDKNTGEVLEIPDFTPYLLILSVIVWVSVMLCFKPSSNNCLFIKTTFSFLISTPNISPSNQL